MLCLSGFELYSRWVPLNISFVPRLPKRSATILDPFAQFSSPLLGPRTRFTHGFQDLMG